MNASGVGPFLAGVLFFAGPPAFVVGALALRASGRIHGRHVIVERLNAYRDEAARASQRRGVELSLVLAVASVESSGDPSARSGAGAVGLMQLMPATARELAESERAAAPRLDDPAQSLDYGALYLRRQLDRFAGHPAAEELALAAYNAGPNRVQAWLDSDPPPAETATLGDWIPYGETRAFVSRVQGWRARWRLQLAPSAPDAPD